MKLALTITASWPASIPDAQAPDAAQQFHDYVYLRDNPAGEHRELWFHEQGDRSWLVVTRNTLTHAVIKVELARGVALAGRKTRSGKR